MSALYPWPGSSTTSPVKRHFAAASVSGRGVGKLIGLSVFLLARPAAPKALPSQRRLCSSRHSRGFYLRRGCIVCAQCLLDPGGGAAISSDPRPLVERCFGPALPRRRVAGDDGGRGVVDGALRSVQHRRRPMVSLGRPLAKASGAQDLQTEERKR